jgi:hypothetical protein
MVGQFSSEFLATKLDGFGVQAGDAGEFADGWGVGVVGQGGDIPAALRLGHATEQQVDLVMVAGKLGVGLRLAGATYTAMHNWFRP